MLMANELTTNAAMIHGESGGKPDHGKTADLEDVADEGDGGRRDLKTQSEIVPAAKAPAIPARTTMNAPLLEDGRVKLEALGLLHVAREPLLEAMADKTGTELRNGNGDGDGVGEDLLWPGRRS